MGKISAKVLKFRRRSRPGAIMSAKTFRGIARRAGGGAKGARIAGAAYWNTVRAKFRKRKK